MGSSPDPFGAGAYNLQSISTLRPKGLVHETMCDVTSFSPCTDSIHELRDLHFMSEKIDLHI